MGCRAGRCFAVTGFLIAWRTDGPSMEFRCCSDIHSIRDDSEDRGRADEQRDDRDLRSVLS